MFDNETRRVVFRMAYDWMLGAFVALAAFAATGTYIGAVLLAFVLMATSILIALWLVR